jgi:hypothetical protein
VSKTADGFLTSLVAEDFTAATSLLEPGYAQKLTPGRLKQSWEIFRRIVGEFKRELGVRTENDPKGPIVAITCEFERRTMDLWLRFNSAGQIVDVRFVAPGKTPSLGAGFVNPALRSQASRSLRPARDRPWAPSAAPASAPRLPA